MFNFFKKNKPPVESAQPQEQYAPAPGTEIRYDPTLVDTLKRDHQQLLTAYGEIQAAFEDEDFELVSAQLNDFRAALHAHLLTENVRLYIYLNRQMAGDELNSDLIHGFRREMDSIGRNVLKFLKKYQTIGVDRELAPAFGRDFAAIGKVLVERIQQEESTLYPLYMPHY